MLLNAAFLLTGWFVTVLLAEISNGPLFATIKSAEDERPTLKEIFNGVEDPELEKEYESPSLDDEYPLEGLRPGYPDYPDYENEDPNMRESYMFKKEWEKVGVMEVSSIGRPDPNPLFLEEEDMRRRRGIRQKKNTHRERDVLKAFDRTKGCNRLPVAPANSSGTCHHADHIAKCWVRCHRFNRYPDSTRQKTFLCLDGLWQPTKLPDCGPQTLCEETYISGSNMRVSCILEDKRIKCTGACEDGFTFPDSESVKEIECEELDGKIVSNTKFPDCYYNRTTSDASVNMEEWKNDTWIYF